MITIAGKEIPTKLTIGAMCALEDQFDGLSFLDVLQHFQKNMANATVWRRLILAFAAGNDIEVDKEFLKAINELPHEWTLTFVRSLADEINSLNAEFAA